MKILAGKEAAYAKYVAINDDPYSKAVVTYTERWATLMEEEIARGKTVAECAEETSHKADTEGITGFMYGCAVQALVEFWPGGNYLRIWHNNQYGVSEEKSNGGVVNPAIMTIK